MPKIKTKRSAAKRFSLKASGKIKRAKANKSHLLTHKPAKRKLQLRGTTHVCKADEQAVKRMLGH